MNYDRKLDCSHGRAKFLKVNKYDPNKKIAEFNKIEIFHNALAYKFAHMLRNPRKHFNFRDSFNNVYTIVNSKLKCSMQYCSITKPGGLDLSRRDLDRDLDLDAKKVSVSTVEKISTVFKS